MNPAQARAARAYLNLDMKTVCAQAPVGKRTLTEFERGSRALADTTLARLKGYYIAQGIIFSSERDINGITKTSSYVEDINNDGGEVKTKLEYDDRFGLNNISNECEKIISHVSACSMHINFSREILNYAISISNLNQKQFANRIGRSPAFISAVMLQKKFLSSELINVIQREFEIDGLSEMIIAEKRIKKILNEIHKGLSETLSEVERVKKVNSNT